MVILDDMECLEVFVGATSMSMNDRFTILADTSPFRGAPGPRRGRRLSTNDGPLLNAYTVNRSQDIIDTVVHELGLDWRVQQLQQLDHQSRPRSRAGSQPRSRAGSQPRSRAGSMSRYGSNTNLPGLVRANSWGNLSQQSGRSGQSVRSGKSGRSRMSNWENFNENLTVSFLQRPHLDINRRLQMRDAWMRGRRGRGRGWNSQSGRIAHRNWYQNYQQDGGRARGRRRRNRNHNRRRGGWRGRTPMTPRGRAGLTDSTYGGHTNGWNATGYSARGNARGRGSGRGRGRGGRLGGTMRDGISQNGMPVLKTLEQLDKELEEYMASAPASLDKQLEEYMDQNETSLGLSMDFD